MSRSQATKTAHSNPQLQPAGRVRRGSKAIELTEDSIRQRAHEIWLERECAPGDPIADWLQAERELRACAQA